MKDAPAFALWLAGFVLVLLLLGFGCRSAKRPQTVTTITSLPMPPGLPAKSVTNTYTLDVIEYPVLPLPAKTNIQLNWEWELPMPQPDYLFEVWATTSVKQPFKKLATVSAPPVNIPITNAAQFYIVRWTNAVLGLASGWNTK